MTTAADPRMMPVAAEEPGQTRRRKAALLFLLLFLLASLSLLIAWYLLFRQPINPIPPIPVSKLPTYSTSYYGVTHPIGVAVSASGDRIYVTEGAPKGDGLVLDSGGKVIATMTAPETGTDHQLVYAAVQPTTNEVYVSDRIAGTIYIYDRDGAYQREFIPRDPLDGWQPLGVAFDGQGYLYVTDLSGPSEKILVFDTTGKVVRTLGEADNLDYPNGIVVGEGGAIYVTDSNAGRLLAYGKDGAGLAIVGRGAGKGNFGLPRGMAIDGSRRLFIADTTAQTVFVYGVPTTTATAGSRIVPVWFGGRGGRSFAASTRRVSVPAGPTSQKSGLQFLGSFGVQGIGDGQFSFPNSVAVDARGRVYVTDTFNDRVQLWSY